jgi:hypothetical protein
MRRAQQALTHRERLAVQRQDLLRALLPRRMGEASQRLRLQQEAPL